MAKIQRKTGRIKHLRVHEEGTKYGPPSDQIDAEVIVRFANDDSRAYGLPLKNNNKLPAAQAMFALLQDAFNSKTPVTIEYVEREQRNHHLLFRVWRES